MAYLNSKALFFTTSPRTPSKMVPEIQLLYEHFNGRKWNKASQVEFINLLAHTGFFEGSGSSSNKDFSARDRINRGPKALGFVDLSPKIQLTDAGKAFAFGKRPQEIFLRQLLKFQLPSPYHIEKESVTGSFYIKPYLEIIRLIRDLNGLSFDELKIFGLLLTDYRHYNDILERVIDFRNKISANKGGYKKFVDNTWSQTLIATFSNEISSGNTRTRETNDNSLERFLKTKKSNARDYTDACFRYLRYTGLVSISHKNRSISIYDNKLKEVDYILSTVDRNPVFINDEAEYKKQLFNSSIPTLYTDNSENIIDCIMRMSDYTKQKLMGKSIDELKDIHDAIISKRKEAVIKLEVEKIKSYSLYSEIIDTYNEIISDGYYDAPLMLEYNTWRAMTMLDGGVIKGNFKFDDAGQPLSTAAGNMPDIECDYDDFILSVEVTMQQGQRQYESEGEPVARHLGQIKKRTEKEAYCLFIAPTINHACLAHFFALNKMNIVYYGGRSRIIPLDLDQFMLLVEHSYNYSKQPNPNNIKQFLDDVIRCNESSLDENEWHTQIQECVSQWLMQE